MALKDANGGKAWFEWEEDIKRRKPDAINEAKTKYSKEIENYCIVQFFFDKQWKQFREYLVEKEIKLIGDIPIYQFSGHCAQYIPMAASDFSSYVSALIGISKIVAGAVAAGACGDCGHART